MIQPPASIGHIKGLIASLSLPVVVGTVAAMSAVSLIAEPRWGDQSLLLYEATQVLNGARVGTTDLVESNPPLIIWMSEIPVMLSHVLGVLPQTALKLCLGLLVPLSVAWCVSLVQRTGRAGSRAMAWWLAAVILYATTVHPWPHLGQREHILVLLILPYLVMAAVRIDGVSPPAWEGAAAGLAAALGFSLKPQHLVIAAGIEILLAYRKRTLRSMIRPEAVALASGGLAYCAAVWIFTPEYLTTVMPFLYEAYFQYDHVSLLGMIEPMRAAKMAALVLLWAVLRPHLRYRALCAVLVIAALGGTVGYLVQEKGLEYQFLPALAFFTMLLGTMIADGFLQWSARQERRVSTRLVGAVALASGLVVGLLYYPFQSARAAGHWINDRVVYQQTVTARVPRGTTIWILSPSTSTIFDFMLNYDLKWGSRFPHLWMLSAIFEAARADDEETGKQQLAKLAGVIRWTRSAIVEDLKRWHPSLILVERCDDPSITRCEGLEGLRVDVLGWFEDDPDFRAVWTANYEWRRQIGPYDLWCSKRDQSACQHVLAGLPATASRMP